MKKKKIKNPEVEKKQARTQISKLTLEIPDLKESPDKQTPQAHQNSPRRNRNEQKKKKEKVEST